MQGNMGFSSIANIKSSKQKEQDTREEIIKGDIAAIDNAIESNDKEKLKSVHIMIEGKYSSYIHNFGHSMHEYSEKNGFEYDFIGQEAFIHNLLLMKAKLQGLICNFSNKSDFSMPPNSINVNVTNTNEVNLTISFEHAKETIENMPGLNDADTEEIKTKIDELETITKEKISKKKKWEKVKPILIFALDKGADVAITIMSLIIQMKLGM